MDQFDQTKRDILANLGVVDYSPKGSVDKEIVPLINLVNANHHLVTTSSCAGRVSVFIEGDKSGSKLKVGGKGEGGHWLFFTHSPAELVPQWRLGLRDYEHPVEISSDEPRRYVLYKFEPFILHVKCRSHEAAKRLFSLALFCGFRESGIGSNDNVAIRISMRIDAPLGYLEGRKIRQIASPEYIAELDKMALEMFAKNQARIDQLTEYIAEFDVPVSHYEPKEKRAARKRQEGIREAQKKQQKQANEVEVEPIGDLFGI